MSLELGQNERPVLQNLSVELGVGEDEGAHRLEAILQAGRCLRGGDAVVRVRVPIRGGHQLRVGPARQEKHPFLRLDPIIQSVLIVVSISAALVALNGVSVPNTSWNYSFIIH